jgi:outer membrane protein assembly factor BamA
MAAAFLAYAGAAHAQQYRLLDMKVSGNQRFPAAAVMAASALRVGQLFTAKDVDAAKLRLADTGLFATVDYRYDPKTVNRRTGNVLTWKVEQAPISATARLDFPGIDEQQLWKELKQANTLMDPKIPSNALVVEYYRRNIEAALRKRNSKEQVISKNEGVLGTGQFFVVFRLAILPKVP